MQVSILFNKSATLNGLAIQLGIPRRVESVFSARPHDSISGYCAMPSHPGVFCPGRVDLAWLWASCGFSVLAFSILFCVAAYLNECTTRRCSSHENMSPFYFLRRISTIILAWIRRSTNPAIINLLKITSKAGEWSSNWLWLCSKKTLIHYFHHNPLIILWQLANLAALKKSRVAKWHQQKNYPLSLKNHLMK